MSKNLTKFKRVQVKQSLSYNGQRLITQGKIYNIIRGGWRNLYIIDDVGDEMQIYHDNASFRYMTK